MLKPLFSSWCHEEMFYNCCLCFCPFLCLVCVCVCRPGSADVIRPGQVNRTGGSHGVCKLQIHRGATGTAAGRNIQARGSCWAAGSGEEKEEGRSLSHQCCVLVLHSWLKFIFKVQRKVSRISFLLWSPSTAISTRVQCDFKSLKRCCDVCFLRGYVTRRI